MVEYLNIPYVDKMYEMGDGPEFDKSKWTSVQSVLGFNDFSGSLPYLIDGDTKLSGQDKIMRYLASTYSVDLLGYTPEHQ